jgi:hypothetical protein
MNEKVISEPSSVWASSERGKIALFFFVEGKGLFALSFKPFKGAKVMGAANGNFIVFRLNDDEFVIESNSPYLPNGKWLVWVRNAPDFDTKKQEEFQFPKGSSGIAIMAGDFVKYFFSDK